MHFILKNANARIGEDKVLDLQISSKGFESKIEKAFRIPRIEYHAADDRSTELTR
jgi:hypothetical protein